MSSSHSRRWRASLTEPSTRIRPSTRHLDKNRTLYIHASTNGWRVEITYDAAGILRTTHLMPDMNSVHQLQHALRLAGVDKEINL